MEGVKKPTLPFLSWNMALKNLCNIKNIFHIRSPNMGLFLLNKKKTHFPIKQDEEVRPHHR